MLQRKAYEHLVKWKNTTDKKALLITGARQIGKTYIIRKFAEENYSNFIEINFITNPDAAKIFNGDLNAETILINLTAYTQKPLVKGDTLIFFDEIQECPSARTAIKFLVDEYRKRMIKESYTRVINSNTVDEMIDITRKTLENVYKCEMPKDLDTESIYNNYLIEIENYNKSQGFKSNFYSLDEIVGKFQRGRLITVFARSGVGKSTFAIQTASNMVIQGNRVVYGSGEMSVKEVLDKISSSKLNIKHSKFTGNTLTREEKDKVNSLMVKLMENRFYITNETDINKFLNEVRLYKLKNGLDVLFVDYVNKYVTGISGITLTEKIGQVTSILKEFALKEKVCVVLLAQANRKSDGNSNLEYYEKLEVNDIQDSARIEQDSDQVIALYRNIKLDNPQIRENLNKEGKLDYNSKKAEKNPNCINLTVLKNRHGKKGTIALNWDGDYSRISNFMR